MLRTTIKDVKSTYFSHIQNVYKLKKWRHYQIFTTLQLTVIRGNKYRNPHRKNNLCKVLKEIYLPVMLEIYPYAYYYTTVS